MRRCRERATGYHSCGELMSTARTTSLHAQAAGPPQTLQTLSRVLGTCASAAAQAGQQARAGLACLYAWICGAKPCTTCCANSGKSAPARSAGGSASSASASGRVMPACSSLPKPRLAVRNSCARRRGSAQPLFYSLRAAGLARRLRAGADAGCPRPPAPCGRRDVALRLKPPCTCNSVHGVIVTF